MKLKIITLLGLLFINASWLHAQLKISTGGTLYNNGAMISLNDITVNNEGAVTNTPNSVIVFSGVKDDTLKSTGLTNFYGLAVNKTGAAKVYLQTNIKVQGPLTMSSNKLDLGNNTAELVYPSGLVMNETENNRIISSGTGEIFITQTLNNPSAINPGNLGAVITSAQNLGVTTIKRGHQIQSNVNGGQSIARYYKITPANNSNLNASFQFKYLDAELNNISETMLSLYRKPAATWELSGKDAGDIAKNFIQKNGILSFSMLTLGKINNPANLTTGNNPGASLKKADQSIGLAEMITVGPNPTMGDLKIALSLKKANKINVIVTDAKGSMILQKLWQASPGISIETLRLNNQPSGIYMVKVFASEGLGQTFRILKQ